MRIKIGLNWVSLMQGFYYHGDEPYKIDDLAACVWHRPLLILFHLDTYEKLLH